MVKSDNSGVAAVVVEDKAGDAPAARPPSLEAASDTSAKRPDAVAALCASDVQSERFHDLERWTRPLWAAAKASASSRARGQSSMSNNKP